MGLTRFFRQIRVFINTCKVHRKEIWEKVHPCCLCVLRELFSSRLTQLSLFLPDRDMTMDVHLLDPSLLWYMCIKSPMTFFERLYSTEVVNTYSSMFVLLFCHIKSLEDKHTLGQKLKLSYDIFKLLF